MENIDMTLGNICKPYAIGFANWLLKSRYDKTIDSSEWVLLDCYLTYYTTEELYTLYLETL